MFQRYRTLVLFCIFPSLLAAQPAVVQQVKSLRQKKFAKTVPAGNYSGIAPLGGGLYAVVDDKAKTDGFHLMRILQDSVTGKLREVRHEGFVSSGLANRDEEGIAYRATDSTVYIAGERDNAVLQYRLNGSPTGRRLQVPACLRRTKSNRGLESLTCCSLTHRFWTTTECAVMGDREGQHVLQAFDDDLLPTDSVRYETHFDLRGKYAADVAGISDLLALPDGSLLVLERRIHTAKPRYLGSFADCALYHIPAKALRKGGIIAKSQSRQIWRKKTRINLTRRNFANYEGLCLGARLTDGRQTVILVADSQNQYKGILRDWFNVIVLPHSYK